MSQGNATRFRINTPQIAHEAIDEEVIIVDFESGNYFSLEGAGALIWTALAAGVDFGAILQQVEARYDCSGADVAAMMASFLAELLDQGLVTPERGVGDAIPRPKLNGVSASSRPPFSTPVLHRYTDMQELLLLDPIHDVDETGWPNLPLLGNTEA